MIGLSLSELQRSRVILRPELADNLPPITGDRIQLQQVILNLILNASEAMKRRRGSSDAIGDQNRTRRETIVCSLTVEDAGVGFEPHDPGERLFEAFYTTKSGGMGTAYPSVAPLLRVIMAAYGQYRIVVEARFHFLFRADPRV